MSYELSRRSVLQTVGAAGLATGLAGCAGDGDDGAAAAAFGATLSDDGSIPGHSSVGSAGAAEVDLEGTDEGNLTFEVSYEDLEGPVNGVHIHGDGAADGGYLVRFFEPSGSEHADEAITTGDLLDADEGSLDGTVRDEHVNPSGDYDGEIETVEDLVTELEKPDLGESGGVVNVHTEFAPDSELAGQLDPQ
jgi:hypothetical protein